MLTCYYLLCVYEQGMGTPLMTKLGSSKVMDAGADSHVPTPNARKQAVGKTAIFEPFIYKMHYFTKTGSGQT